MVRSRVAMACLCGAAAGALLLLGREREPAATTCTPPADATDAASGVTAAAGAGSTAASPGDAVVPASEPSGVRRTGNPAEAGPLARTVAGPAASAWPRSGAAATASAIAAPKGEPTVPESLAFRALWYLGVDPEAERTWARAINDRNHSEEVRSDLICDMVDEGYSDNNRPGKVDLPLIAARLDILERHAPLAIDDVNRRAFVSAYRSLLELYVRLGGQPRLLAGPGGR